MSARTPAIVVLNGCFCPVHSGHVQALVEAKQKIEAGGNFKVVGGYFAVAPDGYVRKKIDGKLEHWMTAAARTEICRAVAQDVSDDTWTISAEECESWKRCAKAMIDKFHSDKTVSFGVRDEVKKGGVCKKNTGDNRDLSSTIIRAEFAKHGRTADVVDDLIKRRILGRSVGDSLKQMFTASPVPLCAADSAEEAKQPEPSMEYTGTKEAADAPGARPSKQSYHRTSSRITGSTAGYPDERERFLHTDQVIQATDCKHPFREIRAIHDDKSIIVYQAYNRGIGESAAKANSFRAPMELGLWKPGRMTWIKPSAVWMAYRCGWTTMKDKNQECVLALRLSRDGFESLLMEAQLSHSSSASSCKDSPVVVQWDPEREMDAEQGENQVFTRPMSGVRSIQIGLRGSAVEKLLDPAFVLEISDVTWQFRSAAVLLGAGDVVAAGSALWPKPQTQERPMSIPPELQAALGMTQ